MKAKIFDLSGKEKESIDLPSVFNEPVRTDLIKRGVLALESNSYQRKGNMPVAGLQTSADFFGSRHTYRQTNARGISRLPRVKLAKGRLGDVKRVPQSVGGRRSHGPKVLLKSKERINNKERKKAIRSALAATLDKEIVIKRGHKIDEIESLPLIIIDDFQKVSKTKEVKDILIKLGLEKELERGSQKRIRAGRGTTRGRRYRRKKSVLIVVGNDNGVIKACNNIPGVEACPAKNINSELLAPGGDAGRITVYTKSAIDELQKRLAV